MADILVCCRCGEPICDRAELPKNERALVVKCEKCGTGLVVDTTDEISETEAN